MTSTGLNQPKRSGLPAQEPGRRKGSLLLYLAGGLALIALLLFILLRMRPPEMHGVVLQSPQRATDFTLTASTGEPISLSDLRGKHVLIYFGYTFCPDVCPTTLADLRMMAQELGEERMEDVQVVMVSVDPERDTPDRLADYMGFFDPTFLGMTGPLEEIIAASTQFGVYFEQNRVEGASEYLVDHTSTVTLIDPDGYIRMVFPYGTAGEDMAADVQYWMRR
jgi:protein SCO1/2